MRLWRGSLVALLLTMLVAALPVALGVAAADDPATVLQRFTDARNRGDVAGAIALLADNGRFVEGPTCSPDSPCVGPAAVRPFLEQSVPLHIKLTAVGTPQVSGTTVRQRFEVRGDPFTVAGIERFVGNATVEVRDGKIASYLNIPDASDAQVAATFAWRLSFCEERVTAQSQAQIPSNSRQPRAMFGIQRFTHVLLS